MKSYDNFFLPVNDLAKAKQFYNKVGLSIKFEFPEKGMLAVQIKIT